MSVVAWDGNILASDGGSWSDGMLYSRKKIWQASVRTEPHSRILVGAVGVTAEAAALASAASTAYLLEHGGKSVTHREIVEAECKVSLTDVQVMLFDPWRKLAYMFDNAAVCYPIDYHEKIAIGHSSVVGAAMGLMLIAKMPADEAVKAISDLDTFDTAARGMYSLKAI